MRQVKKFSVDVCGYIKAFSKAIKEHLSRETLSSDGSKEQRAKKIAEEKKAWEDELDNWTHEKDPYSLDVIEEAKSEKPFSGGEYLHPRQVLRELEKAMPEDVMISTDI